jgi:hypothetical protein
MCYLCAAMIILKRIICTLLWLSRILELSTKLTVVYFNRLKINHDSHEFILESGTVVNNSKVHLDAIIITHRALTLLLDIHIDRSLLKKMDLQGSKCLVMGQQEFLLYFYGDFLWRRHIAFFSKIILIFCNNLIVIFSAVPKRESSARFIGSSFFFLHRAPLCGA